MDFQRFESEYIVEKEGDSTLGTLRFSGDLTIQDAASIKETVLEALSKTDDCRLDFDLVNIFDLSSIQIFFAACNSAAAKMKKLELKGECPSVFRNAVIDAGFERIEWLCFGESFN